MHRTESESKYINIYRRRGRPARGRKYSVHLGTQYFLTPVCPVKGTETGLTGGGGKRQNTKWRSKVNAMQKNRKGFAPFPENS